MTGSIHESVAKGGEGNTIESEERERDRRERERGEREREERGTEGPLGRRLHKRIKVDLIPFDDPLEEWAAEHLMNLFIGSKSPSRD